VGGEESERHLMRIRERAHEECRAHGVYGQGEDYECMIYNLKGYTYSVIYSVW
jgi:hypothetical protein